jgi:hypothetical protein
MPDSEIYVPDRSLPSAIMVDLDGTLALHVDRGPYEFERLGEDALNEPVALVVATMRAAGHRIVLMSGREARYRELTEKWLADHDVVHDELWMRATDDRRHDDVVKAELFDAHVRRRFHIRFVLDDRDRVVAAWRRMGLPCWQVDYGDF